MPKSKKKSPALNLTRILKSLATKNDIGAIRKDIEKLPSKAYVDNRFLAVRKEIWKVTEDVDELKERVKLIPTREEYSRDMDKVIKELATVREEQAISSDIRRQTNDLEDRVETVEEKLGIRLPA